MNLLAFALGPWELILVVSILGGFGFWLWMLVDCATQEHDQNQKLIWILLMVFVGVVATPLYFLFRKLPRPKTLS